MHLQENISIYITYRYIIYLICIKKTLNLIYVIYCDGCTEEYIGQTGGLSIYRLPIHREQMQQPECQ